MAPVGSEIRPEMLPRPAWAPASGAATSKSIEIQSAARRELEVFIVFILAISNQNVDIQTFE
jgi:hypothetical protein